MPSHSVQPRFRLSAFSLAEVTLALGIFVFALVSVIGLMPLGFASVRDSRERFTHSEILRSVTESLANSPFQEISAPGFSLTKHLDNEGRVWTSTLASAGLADVTYRYMVEIRRADPQPPGLPVGIAPIEVIIKNTPGGNQPVGRSSRWTVHIADRGL